MSNAGRTNWLVAIGGIVAVFGIILYGELGQIEDAVHSLSLLNAAATLSIVMTVIGLLAALIGVVMWASHAPLGRVVFSGAVTGFLAALLAEVLNVNVHGPTAIFIFVIPLTVLAAILVLLTAAVRFLRSRWQQER